MSFKSNPVLSKCDEYYTRRKTLEDIRQYIPSNAVLYEPFYGNGQSVTYLRDLGYQTVFKDVDFFSNEILNESQYDMILTNPPFTKKKEVLQKLKIINKPFIAILPMTVVFTLYFHQIFNNNDEIQMIIPNKHIHYDNDKIKKDNTSFYSIYLCYKMNLNKDINFLKI